jgi:hypothetical protein
MFILGGVFDYHKLSEHLIKNRKNWHPNKDWSIVRCYTMWLIIIEIPKTRKELFEILRQQNSGEGLHRTSYNQNHTTTKPRNTMTASKILKIREYRSRLDFCVKTTRHQKNTPPKCRLKLHTSESYAGRHTTITLEPNWKTRQLLRDESPETAQQTSHPPQNNVSKPSSEFNTVIQRG